MEKKGTILMHRYEMGRLLGQGTFAKVYYGRNTADGQGVAIKIVDKEKVMKVGLVDQIKREIAVMRLVRHPNVVRLYEVMASKRKIYFVMEYVRGGELFNKVAKGRLKEDAARQYFQQLVAAVDYCHSRGVYHRDLKPENLLLDEKGNLKVSDFGLSALLSESQRQVDGLLHTTCGTPAYVAPEVLSKRGYDGAKADIWSCGVVLFVLLAGQLPFHDANLMNLYRKISKGEFKCPQWFPSEVRKLLSRILDPHPSTRITVTKLMDNVWFKKGFKQVASPPRPTVFELRDFITSDVAASFEDNDSSDSASSSCSRSTTDHLPPPASDPVRPSFYNAFNIISLSKGFDLSGLFEEEDSNKKVARFTSKRPVPEIVAKLEEVAVAERFQCGKMDGTVKLVASTEGRKGQLEIDAEIFEVTPSFHVVELKKMGGDTFEYTKFCYQELKPSLKDIVWTWEGSGQQ